MKQNTTIQTRRMLRTWFAKLIATVLLAVLAIPWALADTIFVTNNDLATCAVCELQARRRVAVMEVNMGEIPAYLQTSADAIAGRVRDQIEVELGTSPAIIPVNRTHLDSVLQEQRLATSGAFVKAGAPKTGRLITAQLLLHVNVDRVDVSTVTQTESHDNAEAYIRQAVAIDAETAAVEDELRALNEEANRVVQPYGSGSDTVEALNSLVDTMYQGRSALLVEKSRRLRARAEALRAEARLDGEQTMDEQRRITAAVTLGWMAIDVSTGVSVAAGRVEAQATGQRLSTARHDAFGSSTVVHDSPDSTTINDAMDQAIRSLSRRVEIALAGQPFRARVAAVTGGKIIINAGAEIGIRVGDTFGLHRTSDAIVDPETGLALEIESKPLGAIRVESVQKNVAFGRVIRGGGDLRVGDRLEWIGMIVAQADLPKIREQAQQLNTARSQRIARMRQLERAQVVGIEDDAAASLFDRYRGSTATELIDELASR